MEIWHSLPRDGGQGVQVHWASAQEGAIRRHNDGTETTYTLHSWVEGAEFEPWNGLVGCRMACEPITSQEAAIILAGN